MRSQPADEAAPLALTSWSRRTLHQSAIQVPRDRDGTLNEADPPPGKGTKGSVSQSFLSVERSPAAPITSPLSSSQLDHFWIIVVIYRIVD